MRANQPALLDTQAVAMALSTGSTRRLTAAKGSSSLSNATGNSSRHQNTVLTASSATLNAPVIHANRPRGTGKARRCGKGLPGASVLRCMAAARAASEG
ncbi:hypothetical protein D9M68_913990 [compost metagenome]